MALRFNFNITVGGDPTNISFIHAIDEDWVIDAEQLDDLSLEFIKSNTRVEDGEYRGMRQTSFDIKALSQCNKDIALTRIDLKTQNILETSILHFEVS